MPPLTPGADASADRVVRYRITPLLFWAACLAAVGFVVLVTVPLFSSGTWRAMAWYDWLGMAVVWAWGGFMAWLPTRMAMTRLTLGADGSVRLATRTLFAARDRLLQPGSVLRVDVRRNHFGPICGWQLMLHWREGGHLVVNERVDAAAQLALAEEIARRLGVDQAA